MKWIKESGDYLEVLSPAKVNLFLYVTGKRDDGYHELYSLMSDVGLYDRMVFDFSSDHVLVECDHPRVPDDESNLVVRAARIFFESLDLKNRHDAYLNHRGVSMKIEKNIPVGAGLGGGSSNAATVLMVMNRFFDHPFTTESLMDMGIKLGADVPFFMVGGAALARGIGEKLVPITGIKPYTLLIVFPGIHVSTAIVFKKLNFGLTKSEIPSKNAVFAEDNLDFRFDAAGHLGNDLEKVSVSMHPVIQEVKEKIMGFGAVDALMSGSGSSVFGLFAHEESALKARDMILRSTDWQVFTAEMPSK